MSTEATTHALPALHHHGLRLTLAVVAALLAGWYLDNMLVVLLAPILTVIVLAPGAGAPGPAAAIAGPLAIWLAAGAIAVAATFLADRDGTLLALIAAAVFLCFRHDARKGARPLTGMVLMLVVIVAPTSAAAPPLAAGLVDAIALGLLIAMFAAILAHILLPGPPPAAQDRQVAIPDNGLRIPLGQTAILMVLVGWFILTDKTGGLYILIAAVTVLRMPRANNAAIGLVASNLLGGALAIAVAGLAITTPGGLFTVVLFAAMILVLGLMIETGGTRGAIAQGAVLVAIILFVIGMLPVDGSSAYIERVGEVAATMLYIVLGRLAIEPPARPATA